VVCDSKEEPVGVGAVLPHADHFVIRMTQQLDAPLVVEHQ